MKEYHRALAVVCDDLFFSRFNRSSAAVQALARSDPRSDQAATTMLQSVFDNKNHEEVKAGVVEDLLSVKLAPNTDGHGVQFDKERIKQRFVAHITSYFQRLWTEFV